MRVSAKYYRDVGAVYLRPRDPFSARSRVSTSKAAASFFKVRGRGGTIRRIDCPYDGYTAHRESVGCLLRANRHVSTGRCGRPGVHCRSHSAGTSRRLSGTRGVLLRLVWAVALAPSGIDELDILPVLD